MMTFDMKRMITPEDRVQNTEVPKSMLRSRGRMSQKEAREYVGAELHDELQRLLKEHQMIQPLAKGGEKFVFALHANKKKIGETRERNIVAKFSGRILIEQLTGYLEGTESRQFGRVFLKAERDAEKKAARTLEVEALGRDLEGESTLRVARNNQ